MDSELRYIYENPEGGEVIRQRRLLELMAFAKENVPFYKNYSGKLDSLGDFPVVNKQVYRQHYADFLTPRELIPGQEGELHIQRTSGSTGTPFEVPQDTLCRKRRIAAINLGNELIGFRFLQEPMVHLRSLKQYYSGEPSVINKGLNITYADFQHYHTILSIGLKNGVIGKIRGMDAIAEIPGVYYVHQYRKVGDVMTRSGFIILQDLCRVYVEAPDTVELIKRIQKMLDLIQVENDKGENMLRDYSEGWQEYFNS